jgi:hypothetical protein
MSNNNTLKRVIEIVFKTGATTTESAYYNLIPYSEKLPELNDKSGDSQANEAGPFTGVATITKISGSPASFLSYHGDISRDGMQGSGIMIWSDQHRYEGSFKNNLKDGHGIEVFANGDRFEGEFKDGRPVLGISTFAKRGKRVFQTYDAEGKVLHGFKGMLIIVLNFAYLHIIFSVIFC